MKKPPAAVLYLAVAALLGGYIYFFERKPLPTEAEKKGKVLPNFVSDDITGIRLEAAGATLPAEKAPLVLEKDKEGKWRITAPKAYPADETTIRSALTQAGDLTPESVLEAPADPAPFGLAQPPQKEITFKGKGGAPTVLQVGKKDIAGNSYYVRVDGKGPVYLVQASSIEIITKKLPDYRDHSLFKADPILAHKVRVAQGERTLVLEKDKEGGWTLTSPIKARASESRLRELLNAVSNVRITGFEKDDASDLSPYGLAPAKGRIDVWMDEKAPPKTLIVGSKKKGTNDVFAKQGDLPYVVTLPEYFKTTNIDFKTDDFRDKDVMKFDASQAKTLTLSQGKRKMVFHKDEKGDWSLEGGTGNHPEAGDLLGQLSETSAQGFSGEGSILHPTYSALVALADGTQRVFRYGSKEGDQVALASDRGAEVLKVPAAVLDKLGACFGAAPSPTALPPKK